YQSVADNLAVKEVWVGAGDARGRVVGCRNLIEAERDQTRRARALDRIGAELVALERKRGDARLAAEGALLAHPTLRRYLARRNGRLVTDKAKVAAEARLDGKFLLSTTDPPIPAADLAPLHKTDPIRAHVSFGFLALMRVRVAENACQHTGYHTWPRIHRELDRMHLGEFTGPAGRVIQRSETTPAQREILRALDLPEPPTLLDATPTRRRRRANTPA